MYRRRSDPGHRRLGRGRHPDRGGQAGAVHRRRRHRPAPLHRGLLDVGTDNEQLLQDPFYLGNRHARRRGAEYDAFVDRYIETAHRLFPTAILHFEDFGPLNARRILHAYGDKYCVFNDDIQGTGAVVVAAVYGGCHVTGVPMRDQTVVVFGAGTAGIGVADQIRDAMVSDGASLEQARAQIWPIDKQGLLFDDMDDLRDFQVPYAKNRARLGWAPGIGWGWWTPSSSPPHRPAGHLRGVRRLHRRSCAPWSRRASAR